MAKISSEQLGKNAEPRDYDLVFLGSGAGGKLAAWNRSVIWVRTFGGRHAEGKG
jgi:hypothetical protein